MLAIPSIRFNSGRKPTGAKLALKPVHVWGIRIRLQVACKAHAIRRRRRKVYLAQIA
jgi:hypothetical protein